MKKKKIGEIMLDSGVLIFGDIKNIKKFKQDIYEKITKLLDKNTGKIYEYKIDFKSFNDILFDNKTVNELIKSKILEEIKNVNNHELSTENIINDIKKGYKQINFENGTTGKAFAFLNNNGEGNYPVFMETDENGNERLVIEFTKRQKHI